MIHSSHAPVRCGIILAGGEGKRLEPFVYRLRGNNLPKQYVNFVGTRSMLEHTFDRAEELIPADRLFVIASENHLEYVEARRQLFNRPIDSLVLQPGNRETGPGLLLPLMHLFKRYPEATVAVFPSDHFVLEENRFMAHVALAFRVVEQDPSRMVLLGIPPSQLEPEYGYIVPDERRKGFDFAAVRGVASFVEKPAPRTATELFSRGALWNTMVMVFNAKTFLRFVRLIAPVLYSPFQRIYRAIGTSAEAIVVKECYEKMEPLNLSKHLLEPLAANHGRYLNVMAVDRVLWSDWGSAPRIMEVLGEVGYLDRFYRALAARDPGYAAATDAIDQATGSAVEQSGSMTQ
jgi:mannose-1-phosphate guanylyltransferase